VSDQGNSVAVISGIVGAIAGAFCGLIVDQAWDGLIAGGLVSAAAGVVGPQLYKPDWDAPRVAVGAIPHAGWLGGLAAAIYVHAGLAGAFVGCAIGYVGGLLLPVALMMFLTADGKQQSKAASPTNPSMPTMASGGETDWESKRQAVHTRPTPSSLPGERNHGILVLDVNVDAATDLALECLLLNAIERPEVRKVVESFGSKFNLPTNYDLAVVAALAFFKSPNLMDRLSLVQMMARVTAAEWLQEGNLSPKILRIFEDELYRAYKP